MALQKTISLPSGVSGNYVRLAAYRWDRPTREASVIFSLYKDAATVSAAGTALVPIIAKLRLVGDAFDTYLSPAALAAAESDVLAQLYAAAKAEPVISDYGSAVFADAVDV